MTNDETIWLAGYLEGEGSFGFMRSRGARRPRVALQATDEDVVRRAAALMGTNTHFKPRAKATWQDQWRTDATGPKARAVMESILPHMGKRRSARIREVLAG